MDAEQRPQASLRSTHKAERGASAQRIIKRRLPLASVSSYNTGNQSVESNRLTPESGSGSCSLDITPETGEPCPLGCEVIYTGILDFGQAVKLNRETGAVTILG